MRNILIGGVLCLIIISVLFWKPLYVNIVLFFIPTKEKEHLAHFFHLLNVDGFPWVAKGIKPLSTFDYMDNFEYILNNPRAELVYKYEDLSWYLHPINARFRAGLRVWEKYSWLFPSNSVKIVGRKTPASNLHECETIIIINIHETKKVIRENYQIFSEILGHDFSVDGLVKKLANTPEDYEKNLKGSHLLIGILYGFGKGNALEFQQKYPRTYLFPPYQKAYPRFKDHQDLARWEAFLKDKEPFDPNNHWFITPGFKVDPTSQETKKLEEKYLMAFDKIRKEKKGKSELKWSLIQLI